MPKTRRRIGSLVAAAVAVTAAVSVVPAGAMARTSSGGRAYELVSPSTKNGGDVAADSQRTRAAGDGNAIGFDSLAAFGDARGTGVATDYISERSGDPNPGGQGWATHAITPFVEANSLRRLLSRLDPVYVGEFSDDLDAGVFYSGAPVTNDADVANAQNLYRRTNLRTAGAGFYDLITACPLCATSGPLPPAPSPGALPPKLAWATSDFERILFESEQPLTDDTPAVPGVRLFEWSEGGDVQLVGRIPSSPDVECDDGGAPACVPADVSMAGPGAGTTNGATHVPSLTPHTISDGSDGHSRVFFTFPTDNSGAVVDTGSDAGRIFMRLDGSSTTEISLTERTTPVRWRTKRFLDASSDGTRVFLASVEQLTDDAPVPGEKLYVYDTTKPASAPDNLTLVSADSEPADFGVFRSFIGRNEDGRRVYFAATGQLVAGEPVLRNGVGIYLWDDGTITYIGQMPFATDPFNEMKTSGVNYELQPRQSRVTPDGRHVLFNAARGEGLTGYDHGSCTNVGIGCRELYVYSADTGELACASCNPSGAPATVHATTVVRRVNGGSQSSWHETTNLSDDGKHVFFSTEEALVPEDVNGRSDAYEYDVVNRSVHLLSSGTHPSDSWFMDASANGRDAFFVTRERLVGWDRDDAYDLYDARVGGGFPEPIETLVCSGDACQGAGGGAPALLAPATSVFRGSGNVTETVRTAGKRSRSRRGRKGKRCKRGFVKKRVRTKRGKVKRKCVKRGRAAKRAKRAQARKRAHGKRRGS